MVAAGECGAYARPLLDRLPIALVDVERRARGLGGEHRFVAVVEVVAGRPAQSLDRRRVRVQVGAGVDEQVASLAPQQVGAHFERRSERERLGGGGVEAGERIVEPALLFTGCLVGAGGAHPWVPPLQMIG